MRCEEVMDQKWRQIVCVIKFIKMQRLRFYRQKPHFFLRKKILSPYFPPRLPIHGIITVLNIFREDGTDDG